jgi:quinol monooxygenase YgiN
MFGLVVRFTCKDQASTEAFDRLVAATVDRIRTDEPGTLVYAVNRVDGEPLQRVFYELYRDRAAFDAHEEQEHTKKFLDERGQYLSATEVDWLTLLTGKGTAG